MKNFLIMETNIATFFPAEYFPSTGNLNYLKNNQG